ncbi:septum site-determining protein MinC [Dongshaea marina]|uniref:septum site-determining protein MinC n=1 Tax=Dongshaea marina TaxID=2047966 RepID=UPI000D3E211C|nr:septum site-determining protein MinC [Dongshaea marina]
MAEPRTELTGATFTLSVLRLADSDLTNIAAYLDHKIAQAPHFFTWAPVVIDISLLTRLPDFLELDALIRAKQLIPVGVSGAKDTLARQAIHQAGLPLLSSRSPKTSQPKAPELPTTRIHRGHIRSGMQIYAANTNLVVIGAISPGAEVIADGDIHIYGPLRGRAIAGASGNREAKIFCDNLQSELISISGTYQLSEALPERSWQQSVIIRLQDDQLYFEQLA